MFGKPVQQSGSLFGAPTPGASTTGFNFGSPSTGMAGAATPAPASGGFSFGGSNQNPGFSLGSAGTLFTSTNPVLSTVTSTPGGFGSMTPANAVVRPTFSMSQPAQPTIGTSSTSGLFGGFGVATPATSISGGFGFGAPTPLGTTTSTAAGFGQNLGGFGAPSLGLNSSLTPATSTPLGLGSFGSGFGVTSTPSTGFLGPSLTTTMPSSIVSSNQAVPFVGLGGTGSSQTTTGGTKSDSKMLKEYPVPPEMTTVAEDFKKYMKEQKNIREEISRYSSKPIAKVQEEANSLRQGLLIISNSIQRNAAAIRKLKQETAQESHHVEVMQRTKDMSLSMQYENTAPTEYFQRLVATYEINLKTFRREIDMLERHLASGGQQASAFTPQELLATIRRLYETFVYLASELQTAHENLEKAKDNYITHRRVFHGDSTNLFESRSAALKSSCSGVPVTTIGPSPFANAHGSVAFASAVERAQQMSGTSHPPPIVGLSASGIGGGSLGGSISGLNTSAFNLTSGLGTSGQQSSNNILSASNVMPGKPLGGALSAPVLGFGAGLGGSSFGVANSTDFQLQRPPAGNKRGKR